ncbi:MAG: sigma-70 family RNA polymerase sigma factor [Planctomycetes bacterium]|nr:sigma-70 family RNA polymerase sigma factor [Planctomycetota bacterium]
MDAARGVEALIREAVAGDRGALEELLSRVRDPLERHVRLRVGPHLREWLEPADILQETFANALKSIEQFKGADEGAFLRWLKGIAEHVILMAARSHRCRRLLFLDTEEVTLDDVSPSRGLRRVERFERLKRALESLSPEHREVIILARLKGLKAKEIAERMGRSPNAVALLLSRALSKLKDVFGDTESLSLPPESLDDEGGRRGA